MNDMVLIDAERLKDQIRQFYCYDYDSLLICSFINDYAEIVDLETLPLVKELREKLKNAEAERDAAIDCVHKCCTENGLCYGCKNWNRSECTDEDAKYFCDTGGSDMWEWSGLF